MGVSLKTNRLGSEKSPYLLQHARNPVDWYPWGEEAFDRARLGRPGSERIRVRNAPPPFSRLYL